MQKASPRRNTRNLVRFFCPVCYLSPRSPVSQLLFFSFSLLPCSNPRDSPFRLLTSVVSRGISSTPFCCPLCRISPSFPSYHHHLHFFPSSQPLLQSSLCSEQVFGELAGSTRINCGCNCSVPSDFSQSGYEH